MAVILLTDRRELGAPMLAVGHDKPTTDRLSNALNLSRDEARDFIERNGNDAPYRNYRMTVDGDDASPFAG